MLTRRAFFSVAAAGAATLSTFSRLPKLHAAQYDLLIRGGRVIDPSRKLDAMADVGIAGGRIASIQAGIASSNAAQAIDATGRLVVPGLIDIHTHAGRSADAPAIC